MPEFQSIDTTLQYAMVNQANVKNSCRKWGDVTNYDLCINTAHLDVETAAKIIYGERLVFIKKLPVDMDGHKAFVYLCIDEDTYLMQHKKTILRAIDDNQTHDETDVAVKKLGTFAILSCILFS